MRKAEGHPLDDKAALAEWMGYDTVEAMDADHDRLHFRLSNVLGVPSHSMRQARGEVLSREEWTVANLEEDAVLNVQRWLKHIDKLK